MSSSQVLAHDWFPRRLPANVEIGPASWLYSSYAFVHYCSRRACGLRVGHDTGLYHGTFFDLGPEGEVVIGDYCTVVGAIFATRGRVELGSYSFVAHEVVIADEPSAVPPGARSSAGLPLPGSEIRIGRNVWIGARAIILGGTQIGDEAVIGAGAVVRGVIPPRAIAAGNPARVIRFCKPSAESPPT